MLWRRRKFCQILGRRLSCKCSFLCRWNTCGYRFTHVSLSSGCRLDFTWTHSWMIFVPCLWWWSYFLVYGWSREGGALVLRWDWLRQVNGRWSGEFEKVILTAVTLGWDGITCWGGGWASRAIWADEGAVVVTGEVWLSNAWVCGCGRAVGSMLTAIGFNQLLQFQSDPISTSVEGQTYKRNRTSMTHKHVEGGRAGLQKVLHTRRWARLAMNVNVCPIFRLNNGYLKLLLSINILIWTMGYYT